MLNIDGTIIEQGIAREIELGGGLSTPESPLPTRLTANQDPAKIVPIRKAMEQSGKIEA
jgi:hypothetical protein